LATRGAHVGAAGLEELMGFLGARRVQSTLGILAVGMGAYLGTRFLVPSGVNPASLESQAEELRILAPREAAGHYRTLATTSTRVGDRVGYYLEAASLSETVGEMDESEELLGLALTAAEDDSNLSAQVRVQLGWFLADLERWSEVVVTIEPVLALATQPTEQRARALVLYEEARLALGHEALGQSEDVLLALEPLPETEAELRIAVADVWALRDQLDSALAELERAASLELSADTRLRVLEARARILDQAGESEQARQTWEAVLDQADEGSKAWQAGSLALADLRYRQGHADVARALLLDLVGPDRDPRIRGRALLAQARIHEAEGELTDASREYQRALDVPELDQESIREARVALARLLLAGQEAGALDSLVAHLPEDARAGIWAQAKLGEARRLLDQNRAQAALETFAELVNEDSEPLVQRAARAGTGEAQAHLGELSTALRTWRDLLAEDPLPDERVHLELLVAYGLLQGGSRSEAEAAFRSLAGSQDPEIRVQGTLGLAEVARV
ncbi:MAG: hypothetical protein QGG40_16365, partial [Myxococcota bacterium]|nr:hypothetical protein [Myxococcota bacterium]